MRKIIEALEIGLSFAMQESMARHGGPVSRSVALIESALAEARAAPSGEWVTVPREPTPGMFAAASRIDDEMAASGSIHGADSGQVWDAMLAAAPPAPAAEPVAWAISYDGKTPYSLFSGEDCYLLDYEVKRIGGTACKIPLYTAPPPVEASKPSEHEPEWTLWQFQHTDGTWSQFMNERHYAETAKSGEWNMRRIARVEASQQQDWPECSGDPMSCPENEGYGCCKPNRPDSQQQASGEADLNAELGAGI